MSKESKKYRQELVRQVKMLGREIIDRAEGLVGNVDLISDFGIVLRFPQDGVPTIERTSIYLSKKCLDDIGIDTDEIMRQDDQIKWNYISEVGLPPADKYDWVLIQTSLNGIPYVGEFRKNHWHAIGIGPIEDVLLCKVTAWADMQLIK